MLRAYSSNCMLFLVFIFYICFHTGLQIERSVPIKRVPKAASKLLVAELKEELAGYKQSTVGTRTQLYERVQKARREARARGSEMWVPAGYEGEEPEDKMVRKSGQCGASGGVSVDTWLAHLGGGGS